MKKIKSYYGGLFYRHQTWFGVACAWFFLAFVCGVVSYCLNPGLLEVYIKELFGTPAPHGPEGLPAVGEIFVHNFIIAIFALLGGVAFGLLPLLFLARSGFLSGYLLPWLIISKQKSPVFISTWMLDGMAPHAVIELPALFLACALGLKLGLAWLGPQSSGRRLAEFQANFKTALWAVPGIVALLFLAALIEVFVSGRILEHL